MSAYPTPTAPGWYWAKWRIADDGTDTCRACGHQASEWEKPHGLNAETWGVVEVIENCIDPEDDEYLMVGVGGVSQWQSVENFYWGPAVSLPEELQ